MEAKRFEREVLELRYGRFAREARGDREGLVFGFKMPDSCSESGLDVMRMSCYSPGAVVYVMRALHWPFCLILSVSELSATLLATRMFRERSPCAPTLFEHDLVGETSKYYIVLSGGSSADSRSRRQ